METPVTDDSEADTPSTDLDDSVLEDSATESKASSEDLEQRETLVQPKPRIRLESTC